jgi:SH3-like domain-containing protein
MTAGQTHSQARPQWAAKLGAAACVVVAGATLWALFGWQTVPMAGDITGSIVKDERAIGPSGFPLPRFVTLKSAKVNVRRGPSSEYPVAWVFQRKGLPVEVTAEFENWRRIRDSDGQEGWILQQMLTGKRSGVVAPWRGDKFTLLRDSASDSATVVAQLSPGVMGEISNCDGSWCAFSTGDFEGYVVQAQIWGAYPGEKTD